jgi:hypothetical protein
MTFTTKELLDLETLASGCPTHPGYRGRRPQRVTCAGCEAVWEARHVLARLEARIAYWRHTVATNVYPG